MKLIEPALHSRLGLVRKGTAWALRLPRACIRLMDGKQAGGAAPPVLANSFPKSGTHLLDQIVAALPDRRNFGTFLASQTSSFLFRERTSADTLRRIDRFVSGELVRGHLYHEPEYERALADRQAVHYFIYRDPRDVVLSEVHYLREMNRWHRLHRYFRAVPNGEAAISLSIVGLPGIGLTQNGRGVDYPHIGARFARYAGWLSSPTAYAVRFEDLVGPEREPFVRRIVEHYVEQTRTGDPDALARRALENIQPGKSHTYRKGTAGGWRERFTAEHKQQFKEVAGDLLISLGYEKNLDW